MDAPAEVTIVSRAARGGHPRYCGEVAAALARQGAKVTLLEPADAFAANHALHRGLDVSNQAIPDPSAGWLRQEFAIISALLRGRKSGGTVVFQDTSPARAATVGLLRALTSWRPVSMVHNTTAHLSSRRERLKHAAAMVALTIPHQVLVHNERQRAELASRRKVRATSIDLVPHGTWSDERPSSALRNPHMLLFFGVMRSNSGLETIQKVAPSLRREFPHATIWVVGQPANSEINWLMDSLTEQPNINVRSEFISDDEATSMFDTARFVLLPYVDYSSESGVLMQAMAHEVPVITAGETSVVDRVTDLGVGPAPTGSLLDQLRVGLSSTPEQYDEWIDNLVAARSSFTWDDHARVILASAN